MKPDFVTVGQQLKNGATVITAKLNGRRDAAVVIALKQDADVAFDPYVVWTVDKELNAYSGDYCRTINDAVSAFVSRSA